jgi:hypothetical protein
MSYVLFLNQFEATAVRDTNLSTVPRLAVYTGT